MKRYIGLRFRPFGRDRTGVDCWGLIHLYYREQFGIILPAYLFEPNTDETSEVMARATSQSPLWAKQVEPKKHDIAVFTIYGKPCHVGLIVDAERMLHIEKGIDSVVESFVSTRWMKRFYGVYRYVA